MPYHIACLNQKKALSYRRFSPRFLSLLLRSLIKGVFEQSRSTRSEAFPLTPWRYQICIAKCLYSYCDDLPENLSKIATQK